MPEGTVFCKYAPCYFEEIAIKLETLETNDFYYSSLIEFKDDEGPNFSDLLFDAQENGTDLEMDFHVPCRDGCFDDNQLFAVWSRKDVYDLVNRLLQARMGE